MKDGATRRRRGRPPRVSREQILTSALRIVDGQGLERLTMRRLGAELGVDPMAIYGHIPDKAALFDGLTEYVLAQIEVPAPTGDWVHDLRAVTRAARTTLLAHPRVVPLLGTRPPVTEPAFTLVEAITSVLLTAGFTEEQSADGFDCAGRLLIGHVLAEAGRPPGGEVDGGEQAHRQAQQTLPAERFPTLARVQRAGVKHDANRLFELALDGLIRSLDALRPVT
ncbi:MAG: TetR/AcrR family transcriptional regulator C-terminal domain-containing protein [Nakamurella sp.]